jgi:hypothetical protein
MRNQIKSYWDLPGAARAALTDADMQRYCDLELMVAGVLRPEPLVLLPEEPVALTGKTFFAIEVGGKYSRARAPLLFETAQDAQTVLGLMRGTSIEDYPHGDYAGSASDARVVAVTLHSDTERAARKSELERLAANKRTNESARKAHDDAVKATDKALANMWDNYRGEQALAARVAQVARTWETYKNMAGGNVHVARQFLEKAFPPEYHECRRGDVDLVSEAIGALCAPSPAAAQSAAEVVG